jgi:hypothetical protein
MKISELVKQLNKIKREAGDLSVVFNELSINEDADLEFCIHGVNSATSDKFVDSESGRYKKALVLSANYDPEVYPKEK